VKAGSYPDGPTNLVVNKMSVFDKKLLMKFSEEHRLRLKAEHALDRTLDTISYLNERIKRLEELNRRNSVMRVGAVKLGVTQEELWDIVLAWEKAGKPNP